MRRLLVPMALLAWAGPAAAFEFTLPWMDEPSSLEITETLVLDYHDDNVNRNDWDDDYGDIRNRLNLKLNILDFSFTARIDTTTFLQAPQAPAEEHELPYLDRYAPEKLALAYQGRSFQAVLGDFYASFGRGLVLQVRKIDEIGQDTTLLGAKAEAQFGGFEITALSGFSNPTNTEGVYEKTLGETYDWISGLRLNQRLGEALGVAAHGVVAWFDPFGVNESDEASGGMIPRRAYLAGASLESIEPWEGATLYGELAWMGKERPTGADLGSGLAGYLSGDFALGDWSLLVEVKAFVVYALYTIPPSKDGRYKADTPIHYVIPPLLESEEMEVGNNHDVWGGRLRTGWRPGGGDLQLLASTAWFMAQDGMGAGERLIHHQILGAELPFSSTGKAKLEVGWREEHPQYSGGNQKRLLYLNGLVKVPLTPRHALEVHGTHWWVFEHVPDRDYLKGEWTLTYSYAPWLALGVVVGYDTELSGTQELSVFYDPEGGAPFRQVFLAGTAEAKIAGVVTVRLLAGQMRGGLKCIGSCQRFPPFAGARLETVVRF